MKRKSILWQAAGFAFATFAGTVLHFLYEWTGTLFRSKRVNLGTHEATVLATVFICDDTVVLLWKQGKLLEHQIRRNPDWHSVDSGVFLHI